MYPAVVRRIWDRLTWSLILLIPGREAPSHMHPSQMTAHPKQGVEKADVQKMLDRIVIESCQSSWASPVVLVTKKIFI